MGFKNSLPHTGAAQSHLPGNTTPPSYQVPVTLLDSFIPGYSVISHFLLEVFGFDVTILVSVCFISAAMATCANYIWNQLYRAFFRWFTSSVSVNSDDNIHSHLMQWIGEHEMSRTSRSVLAVTVTGTNPLGNEDDSDSDDGDDGEGGGESRAGVLNFGSWESRIPPRYEPYFGRHWFWHKGRLFFLHRELRQITQNDYGGRGHLDHATITLTCIGRSPAPIKALIEEARDKQVEKAKSMTVVRRPADAKMRHYGGRSCWTRVAIRPSRPMDTVVLDPQQKAEIIADINEYLHPATPRWYANRGIPYRRGYLFHGPPGTGKTSLSFALAGLFGLEIFVVSLLDTSITEESLLQLFNNLPRRCVVLLEDVDSAGLAQKRKETADVHSDLPTDKDDRGPADKKHHGNTQLSLSGLLNAIDGVASHEGRVLVMTTNFPEKLDDALIRPGRVDLQVEFTLASKGQTKELFVRMYGSDKLGEGAKSHLEKQGHGKRKSASSGATKAGSMGKISSSLSLIKPRMSRRTIPISKLEAIADEFANHIPDYTLTPAEIQGFLLMRKNDPRRALADVEKWRDGLLATKAAKAKVVTAH